MKAIKSLFFFGVIIMLYTACGKTTQTETIDPEVPFNPFDTLTYNTGGTVLPPPDPASFVGLHLNIFSQKCNQPACHDGTFEPDFRTIESAYATTVYHEVLKNTPANNYVYRILPGDPSKSMLYRRITVHDPPNLERMPSSGNQLPQEDIDNIKKWIEDGAKDAFDNDPIFGNTQPEAYGTYAIAPTLFNYRLDTIRNGVITNPFGVLHASPVRMYFTFQDMDASGAIVDGRNFTINKLLISENPFDFTNAMEMALTVESANPLLQNIRYSQNVAKQFAYTHSV